MIKYSKDIAGFTGRSVLMKKKIFIIVPVVIACLLFSWGVGPYSSGSAVSDLTDEL